LLCLLPRHYCENAAPATLINSDVDDIENNQLNNAFLELNIKISAIDFSDMDTNIAVCEYDESSPGLL
jgi:hypothetical protein